MFIPAAAPLGADKEVTDNNEAVRAMKTIMELSALLGGGSLVSPSNETSKRESVDRDSVRTWSIRQKLNHPSKAMLARPKECPPYSDPSSVAILEPSSLEYELEDEAQMYALDNDNCSFDIKSEEPKVRFQNTVSVVEIPSHRDMDNETIARIWTGVDEVQENAMRNSFEYHADGKDWRNVTEEQGMVFDMETGEYVHPATWEEIQAERQHQAALDEEWQRFAAMEEVARQKRLRQEKARETHRQNKRRQRQQRVAANQRTVLRSHGASLTRFADS
ncbi:expressed unknown protein [Seminavis robusta]|uniref:Uncharacterized protein n=1 Tax=Seminavis robusta TaxID=568900 RepID=A0A9N8DXH5_9STRA|nr:expressed unknown protein [Seminavis robusta]|eukprot:Sro368_g127950.1 n/a (276) ;mRNA; f:31031-31858